MLMARATEEDMKNARMLLGILEDVRGNDFPRDPRRPLDDQPEQPVYFDEDDPDHLEVFYKRVMDCARGLGRVVWGMDTILDNHIFDESVSHLQLIPPLGVAMGKYLQEKNKPQDETVEESERIMAGL